MLALTWLLGACAEVVPQRDDAGDAADAGDTARDLPTADIPPDAGEDLSDDGDASSDPPDLVPDQTPDATPDLRPDTPVETRVLSEVGDWPDCLSEADCPGFAHGFTGFTVDLDPATGEILLSGQRYDVLEGTIEEPTGHPFGYDTDFIGIRAPVRTTIEITVEPVSAGALIDPHVTTYDGGRPGGGPAFHEITANNDRAAGDVTARTMIAAPYDDAPLFLWLDDDRNWTGNGPVGGAPYGYRVRFVTSAFFPIDVDVSGGAVTRPGFSDLATAGDMHFYRFQPSSGAWRVVFQTTNADFAGALIGFDTEGGDLQPVGLAGDETGGTTVILPSSGFITGNNEHIFGVTDWFGRGTSLTGTPFTYTLTIEPEPSSKAR